MFTYLSLSLTPHSSLSLSVFSTKRLFTLLCNYLRPLSSFFPISLSLLLILSFCLSICVPNYLHYCSYFLSLSTFFVILSFSSSIFLSNYVPFLSSSPSLILSFSVILSFYLPPSPSISIPLCLPVSPVYPSSRLSIYSPLAPHQNEILRVIFYKT